MNTNIKDPIELRMLSWKRTYICIDLKSFYASVECVERGLDPFVIDLVVADPDRSASTICLAVTPSMKKKGVRNRCRVHEIPPHMSYITARPRMQLYIDYSRRIYEIYLRYIAPEDIHVYSVDECFIDATQYLRLYGLTGREFAVTLMNAVLTGTGITATAGIGSNLYLAKIAMDIVAKHVPDNIGILDEYEYKRCLWSHSPLTDFWMIGSKTSERLLSYGMRTMGDIARISITSEDFLYKLFGIDAELLIDHAWGEESCLMSDIKNYRSYCHSLSNSQILMRNYSFDEALVIIKEMADGISSGLIEHELCASSITVCIFYDYHFEHPAGSGSFRFGTPTASTSLIIKAAEDIFTKVTDRNFGIRRLSISANNVTTDSCIQYDLFSGDDLARERDLQRALISVRHKFGKNAVFRGIDLLDCATLRERNMQIGGHKA